MTSRSFSLGTTLALLLPACGEPTATSVYEEPEFARTSRGSVAVEFKPLVRLQSDGSVMVRIRTTCPTGFTVVEGPLTVSQDDQSIFGEGFFTSRCDGRWHKSQVRVQTFEQPFHPGVAQVSASLMVEHPETGEFLQGDHTGQVRIR